MSDAEKLLVLSLAEGITETTAEEVAGGIITDSRNTRLGVLKGTLSRRLGETTLEATIFNNPVCGGLVPGPGGSTAAYFKPGTGTRRILGELVEDDLSTVRAAGPQSGYFPYPLTGAGSFSGSTLTNAPALTYDAAGRLWSASVRRDGAGWGVFLTVTLDGQTVITPRRVAQLTTTNTKGEHWVALTVSPSGLVRCWYADDTGVYSFFTGINSGTGQLLSFTPAFVYAPQVTANGLVFADVVSDGSSVYLATRDASNPTTLTIRKMSALTLTLQGSVSFASALSSANLPIYISLTALGTTLAVIVSSSSTNTKYGSVDTAAMTGSLPGSFAAFGPVAVQPWTQSVSSWFIFAVTYYAAVNTITANPTRTTFIRTTTAMGGLGSMTREWYSLHGRGTAHRASSTEVTPYFQLVPWWTTNSAIDYPIQRGAGVAPSERVIDPSLEVFTPFLYSNTFELTPVARVGVDRVSLPLLPVHTSQGACVSPQGRLALTYLERRAEQSYVSSEGLTGRWAELDLLPSQQPGYAVLPKGSALVAAALPVRWDGIESTEAGFLHTPRVFVENTSGTGATLTGDFLVTAVLSFRDANGETVRSAPALPFPITLAAEKPTVYVTRPTSLRNGITQEDVSVTLFWTLANQTIFYSSVAVPASISQGMWVFTNIPAPNAADVRLYSDGTGVQELLPVCPPSARDVCSIGGRLWLIDAERNSVWPSKTFAPGIAPEFAAQLQLTDFDAQYGKLLAVVDVGGAPHVLAERGVYVIDGYGPDNFGRGQRFSVRLISSVGCRGRHTVAQLPGVGAMFQASDGRFVLLGAGSLKRFDTFGVYAVNTPAAYRASNEVVYPLSDGTGWVAYDWLMDGWTHWTSNGTRVLTASCTQDGRTISYAPSTPGFYVRSVDGPLAGSMSVARGWIAPETPNGDCMIREVWFHARNEAPHDLTITVHCDYDESGTIVGGLSNTVTRTWQATGAKSLESITRDGKYTVAVTLHKPARAVKVLVEATPVEGAGDGELWHPLSIAIPYGVKVGQRNRTLLDGAKL